MPPPIAKPSAAVYRQCIERPDIRSSRDFTLNRAMKGTDHSFSLEPTGMHKLVRDLDRARISLGDGVKNTYDSEVAPLTKMGKSIYFAEDYKTGEILTENHFVLKSPGGFLAPYELDFYVGKTLKSDVKKEDLS